MVFVSVPHTGTIVTGLAERLVSYSDNDNVDIHFSHAKPVDVNRNEIVEEFLGSDHQWLVMIDSDIVPPEDVLDVLGADTDALIRSALVFSMRDEIPYPVAGYVHDDGRRHIEIPKDEKEVYNVDFVGTGCIFIHRSVFDNLQKPYFQTQRDPGEHVDVGEDFNFCERARDAGYDIALVPAYKCAHFHQVDLMKMIETLNLALKTSSDEY